MVLNILPKHVAIIMDGNGRWAEKRKLPRAMGHKAGAKVAKEIVKSCPELGVGVITLFAFGVENWSRPLREVKFLMSIILDSIKRNIDELHEQQVCFRVIGDKSVLDPALQQEILAAEQLTAGNQRLQLNIAINYSGRWDLVQGMRSVAARVLSGELALDAIDESCLAEALALSELPEPDMMIRTSGEERISNFMLWQFAYTEFFFTKTLWPDFSVDLFHDLIAQFSKRQRRFGKTGQQLQETSHA